MCRNPHDRFDLGVNTFKTHSHPLPWPFCSTHTSRLLKTVLMRTELIIPFGTIKQLQNTSPESTQRTNNLEGTKPIFPADCVHAALLSCVVRFTIGAALRGSGQMRRSAKIPPQISQAPTQRANVKKSKRTSLEKSGATISYQKHLSGLRRALSAQLF